MRMAAFQCKIPGCSRKRDSWHTANWMSGCVQIAMYSRQPISERNGLAFISAASA